MRRVAVLAGGLAMIAGLLIAPPANANPWAGVQAWETAQVLRVVDGDTLIVRDDVTNQRARIRLIGINAPEIATPLHGAQCGGPEAKDVLTALVPVGTRVRLASADQSSKGKERPLRVVLAYNETTGEYDLDLAWAMAERGWGVWFTAAREAAMSALYREAIAGAQARGDGIWSRSLCGEMEQPEAQISLRIGLPLPGKSYTDEWVTIRNEGATPVDLSGWMLRDSGNQGWFTLPEGSLLVPGDYRVVHTMAGTPGFPQPRDLYAGMSRRLYANPGNGPVLLGDGAYLLDRYGNPRFWREYPCTGGNCETDPLTGVVVVQDLSLGQKKGLRRASTQWVRFLNRAPLEVCLDGYRVQTSDLIYRIPPGTCLPPGGTWMLHGGAGIDTPDSTYLRRKRPAMWTSGTLTLRSDRDQLVARTSW